MTGVIVYDCSCLFYKQENDCVVECLDLSDDEDLQQSLDLHGLIISSQAEVQPIKTADEVISEIEEMMQVSPEMSVRTVIE